MKRFFKVFAFAFLTGCTHSSGESTNSLYDQSIRQNESVEAGVEEAYQDGEYCAEVEYFNPRTGTRSEYILEVAVESGQVARIEFPNGGWLDQDHFDESEINRSGSASIVTDKGYQYEVKIIGVAGNCFRNVPALVQCDGTTADGDQCERMTDNESGFCWQHEDQ